MKKKLLSMLLVLCMIAGLLPVMAFAADANQFADVDSSAWYYEDVDFVARNEYFKGMSPTEFAPQGTMTRAMLATVLARYAEATVDDSRSTFSDVPVDTWYTGAVTWANENKIVDGYGDGTFHPSNPITREELAAMLCRFISWYEQNKEAEHGTGAPVPDFTDSGEIGDWAKDEVEQCCDYGLFKGYDNGKYFHPAASSTRAEISAVIHRLNWVKGGPIDKKDCKVTLYSEGKVYDSATVKGGETYTMPKNPTRSGYRFLGWALTENGPADKTYTAGAEITIKDDLTLYAVWQFAGSVLPPPSWNTNSGVDELNSALDEVLKDGGSVSEAIKDYASLEFTGGRLDKTLNVTIRGGDQTLGTVYGDIGELIVGAVNKAKADLTQIADAKNPETVVKFEKDVPFTGDDMITFIKACKLYNDEGETTFTDVLANSDATIAALNGYSIQFKVTDTDGTVATYTISFKVVSKTLDDAVRDAVGPLNETMQDYAQVAWAEDTLTVSILSPETTVGAVYGDIIETLKGAFIDCKATLKEVKDALNPNATPLDLTVADDQFGATVEAYVKGLYIQKGEEEAQLFTEAFPTAGAAKIIDLKGYHFKFTVTQTDPVTGEETTTDYTITFTADTADLLNTAIENALGKEGGVNEKMTDYAKAAYDPESRTLTVEIYGPAAIGKVNTDIGTLLQDALNTVWGDLAEVTGSDGTQKLTGTGTDGSVTAKDITDFVKGLSATKGDTTVKLSELLVSGTDVSVLDGYTITINVTTKDEGAEPVAYQVTFKATTTAQLDATIADLIKENGEIYTKVNEYADLTFETSKTGSELKVAIKNGKGESTVTQVKTALESTLKDAVGKVKGELESVVDNKKTDSKLNLETMDVVTFVKGLTAIKGEDTSKTLYNVLFDASNGGKLSALNGYSVEVLVTPKTGDPKVYTVSFSTQAAA